MVATRRKSKQGGGGDDTESTASQAEASTSRVVQVPADVSVEVLSALLPDVVSWDAPTDDELAQIYRLLHDRALELDQTATALEEAEALAERRETEHASELNDRDASIQDLQFAQETLSAQLADTTDERDALSMSCAVYSPMCLC